MSDGSAAIIESNGRILLQQRDLEIRIFPGYWSLFGGHANDDEDPIETLLRELEEELGRKFDVRDFRYVGDFVRVEQPVGRIHIYHHEGNYTCSDFELREGKAMAFVNPKYLSRLRIVPDMENILKQIFRGKNDRTKNT
jgi:8-oxo-dGTP pyrophosphatase MutT (NUDIX family)